MYVIYSPCPYTGDWFLMYHLKAWGRLNQSKLFDSMKDASYYLNSSEWNKNYIKIISLERAEEITSDHWEII